jgi:hypothetical protein
MTRLESLYPLMIVISGPPVIGEMSKDEARFSKVGSLHAVSYQDPGHDSDAFHIGRSSR